MFHIEESRTQTIGSELAVFLQDDPTATVKRHTHVILQCCAVFVRFWGMPGHKPNGKIPDMPKCKHGLA